MKTEKKFLIFALVLIILGVTLPWMLRDKKIETANYTIVSGNDRTYYADTFRMCGRGIIFDDVYGKKIILAGDIDIQYTKKTN